MLCLQNGKFDHPDRLFNDIASVYKNVQNSHSDVKEVNSSVFLQLIPEFYQKGGAFLVNSHHLVFGSTQDNVIVNNVRLPPWALSSIQ